MLIPASLTTLCFVLVAEGSGEVNKRILIKALAASLREVHKLSFSLDNSEERVQPRLNTYALKPLVLGDEFS